MSTDAAPQDAGAGVTATATASSFTEKMRNNIVLIGVGVWALAGVAAIVMSIVCFGFSGTLAEKAIGLAIAFFLGPLYFIFYGVNKSYCRNMGANVSRLVGGAMKAADVVTAVTAAVTD